jgi:hypothetical protein
LRAPAAPIAAVRVGTTVSWSKPDCASNDFDGVVWWRVSDHELGAAHEKLRNAQMFWGADLQAAQREVHQQRERHKKMREFVATTHPDLPLSEVLGHAPTHAELLVLLRAARVRARAANEELAALQNLRKFIDEEMKRRALAVGATPMPGQVHFTKLPRYQHANVRYKARRASIRTPKENPSSTQTPPADRDKSNGEPKPRSSRRCERS